MSNTQNLKDQNTQQVPTNLSFIFSHILDKSSSQSPRPLEDIRVTNNILTILLFLTGYGVYYFIGQFIDIIIIAAITGIAYYQAREKFTFMVTTRKASNFQGIDQTFYVIRIFKGVMIILGILLVPWLRKFLSDSQDAPDFSLGSIFSLSYNKKFTTINLMQIAGIILSIGYIIGVKNILKFINFIRSYTSSKREKQFLYFIFWIMTVGMVILAFVVMPLFLYKEIISTGEIMQQQIQESFGCQLVNMDNQTLPYCTQKLAGSTILKKVIEQLRDRNETIIVCVEKINNFQQSNFGYKILPYEELFCTIVCWMEKANTYFSGNQKDTVISTGTSIFMTIFGNLSSGLLLIFNSLFNATIFFTMFSLTASKFNSKNNFLKKIFTGERTQLTKQITNLVSATIFIVCEHFVLSFLILEAFDFSSINLLLSLILSFMAFIPFFRPWFGVLIFAVLNVFVGNIKTFFSINTIVTNLNLYAAILLVVVYRWASEEIYSHNLVKMSLDEIIINMSVLFGIYQFGVVGIIYGPLIIIVFKCIQKQLFNLKLQQRRQN